MKSVIEGRSFFYYHAVFVAVAFIMFSCSFDDDYGVHLKELKKINKTIKISNWQPIGIHKFQDQTSYDLERKVVDTVERLFFHYYHDSSTYYLQSYNQSIIRLDSIYYLEMDRDTLFYYTCPISDINDKKFIVGEYNYRFMNNGLTSGQLRYYLENRDSLRRVRGDDLPPLPVLKK